jgi:hypothetical protein
MKISNLKQKLGEVQHLTFEQPDGRKIPAHFHITEMGLSSKHFIDCGGTIRTEKYASVQIWVAEDYDHRLAPATLEKIIDKAQPLIGKEDLEIEVEYQSDTVGKYSLGFQEGKFMLEPKHTDCLAREACGITSAQKEVLATSENGCSPNSGCC